MRGAGGDRSAGEAGAADRGEFLAPSPASAARPACSRAKTVDNARAAFYRVRVQSPTIERCPWCGHPLSLVWVHGHGQCARCGTNLEECCRGETAQPQACRAPARPRARPQERS